MPRLPSIRTTGLPVVLTVSILCGSLVGACGIKGPPVPPQRYRPAAVADLSYELTNGSVKLGWTIVPEDAEHRTRTAGCSVYRAQIALAGTDCIDCDASFKKAADVAVPADSADKAGRQRLGFVDVLTPGFEYAYRVICSTAAGVSGNESNVVRFQYPQPSNQQP